MDMATTYIGNEHKDLKGRDVRVIRVVRGLGKDMTYLNLEDGAKPLPTDRLDIRFRSNKLGLGWSLTVLEVGPADLAAFAEVSDAA